MEDKNLQFLKQQYLCTPIPAELETVVKQALREGREASMKRRKRVNRVLAAVASLAVCAVLLTVGINSSPAFAAALSKVPVVGHIVKVLTFKEYVYQEERFNAHIQVPSIEGLANEELQNSLNEKYLEENKKLYEQFMAEMAEMKQAEGGNLGVDSGYEVKTDTDRILSIGRYVVTMIGSSSTTYQYDTIDKRDGILITLPSLFKDDRYVEVISANIKSQMIERMQADDSLIYWVEEDEYIEPFEQIAPDQNFYITEEGKLVICFDKYEVAPGFMGVQEFVIPTDVIADLLVSNEYIK